MTQMDGPEGHGSATRHNRRATAARDYPTKRGCPFHPPESFAKLREECQVVKVGLWNGTEAWLVTSYEHHRKILADSRVSADTTLANFPGANASMSLVRKKYRSYVSMDAPEHTRLRRMVAREFTARYVFGLRPQIEETTGMLIDRMLEHGAPIDIHEHVLLALPSLTICNLLGVPHEDRKFFQEKGKALISGMTTLDEAIAVSRELCEEYLGSLIERKMKQPADDLLGRLIESSLKTGEIDKFELICIARMLLQAGHETTANTMSLGLVTLLQYPDQFEKLKNDPMLLPKAIEELLRFVDASHNGRRRVALADITIGDQTIREGEGIILQANSANRDPAQFPFPDKLDITRDARGHVAFGYGIHQCQGQQLARMEIEVMYGALLARIPDIRLAVPVSEIRFRQDQFVYGVEKLPVKWG